LESLEECVITEEGEVKMETWRIGPHEFTLRARMNGERYSSCIRCGVEAVDFEIIEATCPGKNVTIGRPYEIKRQ